MSAWMGLLGVVVQLELRQRVRSVAWYVLLGVVGLVTGAVILVLFLGLGSTPQDIGGLVFSTVLFLVLLVAMLVTPALCGAAINGEREAGTLAATQLTQVTATQLVLGKLLAAWIASLGFLLVTVPFLLVAMALGGLRPEVVVVGVVILVLEIGVTAAIGVGLSGLLRTPVFSIVTTYLAIAVLGLGSLIAFGIGALVVQETREVPSLYYESTDDGATTTCVVDGTYEVSQPRTDLIWWTLAANPFVVMADAIPPSFGSYGQPDDVFSGISLLVRQAQQAPTWPGDCEDEEALYGAPYSPTDTTDEVYASSVPSWFVGLGVHLLLAGGLVAGAIARTRAPARHLAPGSRIA
ncbi:ABC transporter permease [Agrococcus sp. SGAir0287]|uniref:ABC transporter permease n=1 Tax=Agrococcus sp. SGAir0287 TaxID=2070347 RepID=UPI0020C762EE|nr:ABC transporter permease [Agrococcus sp. SGAir0287]